jgi:hypothetical protein
MSANTMHAPKGVLEGREPILPRDNGTTFGGGEALYTHQQAVISITSRSKPKQLLTLASAQPVHRRGPVGASSHPHSVRQWRLAAIAGALAPRALVVVVAPGHLEQGDRTRFEIRIEEERCCSDSLKIEMVG